MRIADNAAQAPPVAAPLLGIRVLDLAAGSGDLCGRALADLGADVIKVEPPGGDPSRLEPPFAGDKTALDRGLPWLAANVNKRGITCNLELPAGRALLRRLAVQADVLIETLSPGERARLGLSYAELAADNPGLVVTSITPFGTTGPRADWPASDLEIGAASGSVWLAGDPDRPPVRTTLPTSPGWSAIAGAIGTLVAVLARDVSGLGQQVDVSAQESLMVAISHAPAFWDLLGENPARSGARLSGRSVTGVAYRNIWPCADGYVAFALYGGPAGRETGRAMVAWMAERGELPPAVASFDWASFDVATARPETVELLESAIGPFLLGLTRREFFEGVIARNMLGYPAATVEDIWQDEQLLARGFWQQVAPPWNGADDSLPFPGSFALFDGARPPIRRTAPGLGEHNREVYAEYGVGPDELAELRKAGVV